jgi:hypothetical protein
MPSATVSAAGRTSRWSSTTWWPGAGPGRTVLASAAGRWAGTSPPRAHSPHHHPDRFFPVAILSQNAEHDEYVPAGPVRDFHARLGPWYATEPERIEYVEYPGVGHFLTPELNTDSGRRLVAWFERWLPGG